MKPDVEFIAVDSTPELIHQLVTKSQQEHIKEFTPRDSSYRFKTIKTTNNWLAEEREVHWLIGKNNDLAGIIWYRRAEASIKDVDINMETFAIRLYEGYTGKGLARPFMKQSLEIYNKRKVLNSKPLNLIWLETESDNFIARNLYEKFGYEVCKTENGRVTMVLPVSTQLKILSNLQ